MRGQRYADFERAAVRVGGAASRRPLGEAYSDDDLVVIGVHTPEFSFEHEIDRVRVATTERGIDHPVAVDSDYEFRAPSTITTGPALYFIDGDGIIRDDHFGEGRYEQSEREIQRLLGVEQELVPVQGIGVEAEADWEHLRTPETYLNHWRGEHFGSPGGSVVDTRRPYEFRRGCRSIIGRSRAIGRSGLRKSCSTRRVGASPFGSRRAMRIWCCRPNRASPFRSV